MTALKVRPPRKLPREGSSDLDDYVRSLPKRQEERYKRISMISKKEIESRRESIEAEGSEDIAPNNNIVWNPNQEEEDTKECSFSDKYGHILKACSVVINRHMDMAP